MPSTLLVQGGHLHTCFHGDKDGQSGLVPAESLQNNRYAKAAHFGLTYSAPLQETTQDFEKPQI